MIKVKLIANSEKELMAKEETLDERFGLVAILKETERGVDGNAIYVIFSLTIRDDDEIEELSGRRPRFVKLAATSDGGLSAKARAFKFSVGSLVAIQEVRRGICIGPRGPFIYAVFLLTFYPMIPIPISDGTD